MKKLIAKIKVQKNRISWVIKVAPKEIRGGKAI